jgi:hypothetical protein
MNDEDFEGTLVLEKLARIDLVDEFFDAIDSDDFDRVRALMVRAQVEPSEIKIVLRKVLEL